MLVRSTEPGMIADGLVAGGVALAGGGLADGARLADGATPAGEAPSGGVSAACGLAGVVVVGALAIAGGLADVLPGPALVEGTVANGPQAASATETTMRTAGAARLRTSCHERRGGGAMGRRYLPTGMMNTNLPFLSGYEPSGRFQGK